MSERDRKEKNILVVTIGGIVIIISGLLLSEKYPLCLSVTCITSIVAILLIRAINRSNNVPASEEIIDVKAKEE